METITLEILLEYLYTKFAVSFILCLIGVFIKESIGMKNLNSIKFSWVLVRSIVSSAIMSAVSGATCFKEFGVYAVACLIAGIWGDRLIQLILSKKLMTHIAVFILKNIPQIPKDITSVIVEANDEIKNDKNGKSNEKPDSDSTTEIKSDSDKTA